MSNDNHYCFYKNIAGIWLSHLSLDFMLGIWPAFKTFHQLDLGISGLIAGTSMFCGDLLQVYFGILSDRGHQKKLMVGGLLLAGSVAFLSYANHYLTFFFLMLATYLGSGAFHPAAAGMMSSFSTSKKGIYFALFASGGMVGEALSQTTFFYCLDYFNGHTWVFYIPIALIAIWMGLYVTSSIPRNHLMNFKSIKNVFLSRRKELANLYFLQVSMRAIFLAFVFLLPDILCNWGFEKWFCFGGGHSCFIVGSALMSIPAGYLADRYLAKPILQCSTIISLLLFYLFLAVGSHSIYVAMPLLILLGGSMGVVSPLVTASGHRLVPKNACGSISALFMGVASCLAGVNLIISGSLASFFTGNGPVLALVTVGGLYSLVFILVSRLSSEFSYEKIPQRIKLSS